VIFLKVDNPLLMRQLTNSKLNLLKDCPDEVFHLLKLVNEAYFDYEQDLSLLERSIEISGTEYQENLEKIKKLQKKLIHNEKMVAIGQLAAGIAHEINNPLSFVQSNMETLKKYLVKMDTMYDLAKDATKKDDIVEKQYRDLSEYMEKSQLEYVFQDIKELMSEVESGLTRMGKIVNSLMVFTQKDGKEGASPYDLNRGILEILTILSNEIKYVANIEEDFEEIPLISAFYSEMNQAILNIILNGLQAIKISGKFGVIHIKTTADKFNVTCEISDNGIGMDHEAARRIFEPFFKENDVSEGTGLGLSIAYDSIVNKHHGELLVQSEIGVGTTFTIKLPIQG
jgi:two-component system, NtrC family, sensor kinase